MRESAAYQVPRNSLIVGRLTAVASVSLILVLQVGCSSVERGIEHLLGNLANGPPGLPEERVFDLISLAERLSSGAIYGR